jgi:oligopeptidase B
MPTNKDKLKYEEKDDTYYCEIAKTKSKKYLMIGSFKKDSTEFHILDANYPDESFRLFSPRLDGHEYYIEHLKNKFIIRTNHQAPNFKVMECPVDNTLFKHWVEFVSHKEDIYIENIQIFNTFIALELRKKGMTQINIHPYNQSGDYFIEFDEPDYVVSFGENPEISSHHLRFNYSSLKTPNTIYDFDTISKHKILKKQDTILGFNSSLYQTHRIFAKAKDGAQVPISLVYRKDKFQKNKNPLLITGYGSYGVSYDAAFNPFVLSLLDRGFVYAIAQIRGGSDLGRDWYFQGKLLHKKNTFTDFITAAEYVESEGYAAKNKKYAVGRSAGGLLMGAVINMQPSLFKGVIAHVPFVDLMNTMLDASIPLTTSEYAEWGDPHDKMYYDYMLSYSPYDNILPASYPHMLVVAAYQDSQVQYWEAAKWVAKLRATKTDDHTLLLRTMMNASHSGGSGRYERYREKAFEYAFLLNIENNEAPF